jgi:hypothetical protein
MELESESPAADPSAVPAVPDPAPEGRAMHLAASAVTAQPSALGRFARWVFAALAGFVSLWFLFAPRPGELRRKRCLVAAVFGLS